MRRRRDQRRARHHVAQLGDVRRDLVAGQLPTLAGLRALRDLDLELGRRREVGRRDAEAS